MQDRDHLKKQKIVDLLKEHAAGTSETAELTMESSLSSNTRILMQFHNSSITIGSVTVNHHTKSE